MSSDNKDTPPSRIIRINDRRIHLTAELCEYALAALAGEGSSKTACLVPKKEKDAVTRSIAGAKERLSHVEQLAMNAWATDIYYSRTRLGYAKQLLAKEESELEKQFKDYRRLVVESIPFEDLLETKEYTVELRKPERGLQHIRSATVSFIASRWLNDRATKNITILLADGAQLTGRISQSELTLLPQEGRGLRAFCDTQTDVCHLTMASMREGGTYRIETIPVDQKSALEPTVPYLEHSPEFLQHEARLNRKHTDYPLLAIMILFLVTLFFVTHTPAKLSLAGQELGSKQCNDGFSFAKSSCQDPTMNIIWSRDATEIDHLKRMGLDSHIIDPKNVTEACGSAIQFARSTCQTALRRRYHDHVADVHVTLIRV